MRKIKKIFVLFVVLLLAKNVHAACDYETQAKLNTEAATIKAIYEEKLGKFDSSVRCNDGETECPGYNYFKISILNLSENFKVTVKGDNFNKTFTYSDAVDGIVSFDLQDIMNIHTFTFDVYPSGSTNCTIKKIRTFYLTTPRYNKYYDYGFCEDNPDYYLCEKYVTFEEIEITDFMRTFNNYIEEKEKKAKKEVEEKTFLENVKEFIKNHKEIFIGAGCTVLVVGGVVVFLQKKRRKDII